MIHHAGRGWPSWPRAWRWRRRRQRADRPDQHHGRRRRPTRRPVDHHVTTPPTTTTSRADRAYPACRSRTSPSSSIAWGDGTGDPLELAQAIIGFPAGHPDAGQHDAAAPLRRPVRRRRRVALGVGLDLRGPVERPDARHRHPVRGAESGQCRTAPDFYDPIMADLGWTYSNSTGSDPGDEGGPHSINHVYQSDAETLVVDGLTRHAEARLRVGRRGTGLRRRGPRVPGRRLGSSSRPA